MASLAARFSLPHSSEMQDWEWEVADSSRIDEFLDAYRSGELDESERFLLAEMLMQCFENLGTAHSEHPSWRSFLDLLETNVELHIYTIWYWGDPEEEAEFFVSPELRDILRRHGPRR